MNTSKVFLSPERTGGPFVYRQNHSEYLAIQDGRVRFFHIAHLAMALDARQQAGNTMQEHASLILLACTGGKLFEWLDTIGDIKC